MCHKPSQRLSPLHCLLVILSYPYESAVVVGCTGHDGPLENLEPFLSINSKLLPPGMCSLTRPLGCPYKFVKLLYELIRLLHFVLDHLHAMRTCSSCCSYFSVCCTFS